MAQEMGFDASHSLRLGIADRFFEHGSRKGQLAEAGLDAAGIAAAAMRLLHGDAPNETSGEDAIAAAQTTGRSVTSRS